HQNEENEQVQGKKAVGDRDEPAPRQTRDDHGEERVGGDHRHQNDSEHPAEIFELGRDDVIANWPKHDITGQDDEKENETQPKRPDFVWLYVNDLRENAFHSWGAHAPSRALFGASPKRK